MAHGFLPRKGNYKGLISYQKSVIIYDCSYIFCQRFFEKHDRTIDQMIQAARSGKQNIIEGAKASVTSSATELKLTNVARASLEELLEDYQDFLRTHNFKLWAKDSQEASYVRRLASGRIKPPVSDSQSDNSPRGSSEQIPDQAQESRSDEAPDKPNQAASRTPEGRLRRTFVGFLRSRPPEVCANIMICLIHQCNYLLDRQIRKIEEDFVKRGGIRERMYKARITHRKDNPQG